MKNETLYVYGDFPSAWGSTANLMISAYVVRFTGTKSPRVNGKLMIQSNPCTLLRIRQRNAICSYQYRYVSGYSDDGEPTFDYNTYPSSRANFLVDVSAFDQDTVDNAMSRFLQKASSLQANIAVMFAERKKTTQTVLSAMASIAAAARHLKGGRFQQAARSLGVGGKDHPGRDISQQWLALQYGWLPLLSDVHAICGAKPVLGKLVKAASVSTRYEGPINGTSDPFSYSMTNEVKFRCSIRAELRISNSAVANASSFGLTDPLSVAWELVPFSFIVDWFLPVGPYLTALHALDGFEILNPCTTYAVTNDLKTFYSRYEGNSNPSLGSVSGSEASLLKYNKSRVCALPSSVPLPALKNPFSLTHIANAFALLFTAFKH